MKRTIKRNIEPDNLHSNVSGTGLCSRKSISSRQADS